MKVKVKDIAEAAGVSPATVSLVLNNKPSRISSSTQEHIKSIAREMQINNSTTQKMDHTGTKTVGLIVSDVKNSYFNMLSNSVNGYMMQQGYTVFQCNSMNSAKKCLKLIHDLIIKNVEGIIVIPPYHINNDEDNVDLRKCFEKSPIPIVLLDQAVYTLFTDFITADNKQGGYLATKHLIDLGHDRIGCILGPRHNYTTRKRLEGYKWALAEADIMFEEAFIIYGEYDMDSGRSGMEQLMMSNITAVFAGNDLMAAGIYQYAEKNEISVPRDLSVVGYDNSMICDLLPTKLTSIEQNVDSMGAKAGEVLLGRIKGDPEDIAPRNYYFTPILVERASTKKIE